MLNDVVQERGRRLCAKIKGKRRRFPTRDNFCLVAQELLRNIRLYLKCEGESPCRVVYDSSTGDIRWTYADNAPVRRVVIYGVAERFRGDAWQWPPPSGKTIRDELAQSLASLADEEREFIFAYYRKNASQERREKFRRKERNQRRNDGN
ncbi:MAG: hypothetical protein IJO06_13375 [Thermoguttaceae bacterium]|nr:hypothetical protein [Thermoguttaceae bacterium]